MAESSTEVFEPSMDPSAAPLLHPPILRPSGRTLDIRDLNEVIALLEKHHISKTSYYRLGLRLLLSNNTLRSIEQEHRGQFDCCFTECLASWLRKADGVENPTIDTLIAALRGIGEDDVADGIDEERQNFMYYHTPATQPVMANIVNPGVCDLELKIDQTPELQEIAIKLQGMYDSLALAVKKSLEGHGIDIEDAKLLIKRRLKRKARVVSELMPCIAIFEKVYDFESLFEFLSKYDFIGYLNYTLLKKLAELIYDDNGINQLFFDYEKEYAKLLNSASFQDLIPLFEKQSDPSPTAPLGLPYVSFHLDKPSLLTPAYTQLPTFGKFSWSYYALLKQLRGGSVSLRKSKKPDDKEFTSIELQQEKEVDISEWLREGTVNLAVKRVQMLGPPGSGKTCSRCLLLNEDPPPKNDSTPIACRAVKATRISVENGHMKEVNAKALLSSLASDLKEAAAKQMKTTTENCDTKSKEESSEAISIGSPETKAKQPADATESKKLAEPADDPDANKICRDIVKAIPEAKAKLDRHLVYIVDSGGQTAFQELLPLFTRAASLNIITLDLSKGMDEKLDLQYRIDGTSFPCDSNFSYTNIEFLNNVLSSGAMLQLYHSPQSEDEAATLRCPEYFVLGTHSDDAKVTSQIVSEFNEALSSLTSGSEEKGYRIIRPKLNEVIYPVNTMLKPGPERQEESKKLCTTLFGFNSTDNTSDNTFKMPVRWFAFELTLLEKAGNNSILEMDDVLSIGKSLQMNEDDTKEALQYLHNVTIILYYPQVLPDIVFVDPHPILDILSRLLALTYNIERNFLHLLTKPIPLDSELENLRKRGIFTLSLLDKLKDDHELSKSNFINLLLHLHIIVKTQDGYFIHSALPLFRSTSSFSKLDIISSAFESTGPPPDSNIINPLLIIWHNPVTKEILPVPRGIFALAVVNLLKFKQPQFQFPPDSQEYLRYQDAMSFRVYYYSEFIGTIHFIKKHRHIKIYFETNELKYCPLICEAVTEAICSSSVATNLKHFYKLAFACCSTENCYCIVTNEAEEKVECTLCRKSAIITGQEKYWSWFHVTCENSTKALKTLDISDLQKVLHLLKEGCFNGDWEELGLELGLYYHPTLSDIQHSPSRGAALIACLATWLQRADAVDKFGGATYVSLANALERLNQKAVADYIRTKCQINLPQEETSITVSDAPCILETICLRDVRSSLQESKFCDSKWLDLGDQLGLHHTTLKTIEDDYSGVKRRLRETLVKWLERADDASPSWGSLVSALEDIEENTVAEHIKCKWIKRKLT